jgi:hypothetical protein
LSADDRKQVLQNALELEGRTVTRRGDDYFLCRGGNDEIDGANLNRTLSDTLRSRDLPGTGVIQVPVPEPPNYEPKFVSEQIWGPQLRELRTPFRKRRFFLVCCLRLTC